MATIDHDEITEPFEAIHTWFGLTYASYLVLPRSVLQSMPDPWQAKFVTLLEEMQDAFGYLDWPGYRVNAVGENGRFIKDPIPHYSRGRTRIDPSATTPDTED
jgi:hypothetical protein